MPVSAIGEGKGDVGHVTSMTWHCDIRKGPLIGGDGVYKRDTGSTANLRAGGGPLET